MLPITRDYMHPISPFRLMNMVFLGMATSLLFGLIGSAPLFLMEGEASGRLFLEAYFVTFKNVISLGLILGTSLVVFRTQDVIPETIEGAFTQTQLSQTDYFFYKSRYTSRRRSVTFASEFIVVSFVLFTLCQFPLEGAGEYLMLTSACAEYALGVYVGRKLCYAGMMLHALLDIRVTRNLFKRKELDEINSYVNIASTLTIIFVYVHVLSYHNGPFVCESVLGESVRTLLILPAVIATPVLLIFNFYPRIVLRKLYSQSIRVALKSLQKKLSNESVSPFEKRSHLIEFDKMSRDELRYSLRLTLSDLPIGITILIMVLGPLLGR